MDFISQIEKCLGRIADKKLMPMQDGDVYITYADTSHLSDEYDYKPNTPIAKGITEFVSWYQNFYAL
jgi:UDP-glucuronate 4-epimerase